MIQLQKLVLVDLVQLENKYLIALDQSSTGTGWSLWQYNSQNFSLIKFGYYTAEGESSEDRAYNMTEWLNGVLKPQLESGAEVLPLILLEEVDFKSKSSTTGKAYTNDSSIVVAYRVLCELTGALKFYFKTKNIPYEIVKTKDWKKTIKSRGKTMENKVKEAQSFCLKNLSVETDENNCFSVCIGYHHLKKHSEA